MCPVGVGCLAEGTGMTSVCCHAASSALEKLLVVIPGPPAWVLGWVVLLASDLPAGVTWNMLSVSLGLLLLSTLLGFGV